MSVIPVSAPPRVRDRLLAAADGPVPVLHRGAHAVYVDLDGWCLGVVDQHATQVPCALAGRDIDLALLGAGEASVRAGVLHLAGVPLAIGRLRRVAVPSVALPRLSALSAVADHPTDQPPLTPGTVARLIGAGDGLTPRGDDVLCGWLALHRATGVPTPTIDEAVRTRMRDTTRLSATLLDCALRGEAVPEFTALLSALGTTAQPSAEAGLRAVGGSSGVAMLEGARLAAAEVLATGTPGEVAA